MIKGRFNVVTDGQWGSCGKGHTTTFLANLFRPDVISTTNMANAGHTAVLDEHNKFVAKALPSAAILNSWQPGYKPSVMVGPSAAFNSNQLFEEWNGCGRPPLYIHERAGVIQIRHRQLEGHSGAGPMGIASTMQGCGAWLAEKVMRTTNQKLVKDFPQEFGEFMIPANEWLHNMSRHLKDGRTFLHEGSQGFSLDINHGSHYPQCTSRQTTAVQNMADMGVSPWYFGHIYLVFRPFPIRVGSIKHPNDARDNSSGMPEEGEFGNSGGAYDKQEEITWEQVEAYCKAPQGAIKEYTTVTGRLRRVFTFSSEQLKLSAWANGATHLVLNFANYIDWTCYGQNNWNELPKKVREFITTVEDLVNLPVAFVNTGPYNHHVCLSPLYRENVWVQQRMNELQKESRKAFHRM